MNLNIPTRVLTNPRIFKPIFARIDMSAKIFSYRSRVQMLCKEDFYHKNLDSFLWLLHKNKKVFDGMITQY
jgi:hypothetical protein